MRSFEPKVIDPMRRLGSALVRDQFPSPTFPLFGAIVEVWLADQLGVRRPASNVVAQARS
jgi:hypothetical protein